ncbi:high mobility group B protein 9 [Cynara cardunculus var. scolymus]|uniref:high mobility group B protein 9 n=1 Tax=Cynara cardunculus var. scolymus TaxID=59895 RepID=UPI000D623F81|nr:high mobility group B protein 9 [Cynara cardunculus var. scolymus]
MLPAERIGSEGESYPVALASHDDVVKDSSLFWETLRSFHRFMGTKLMVPVIGGKELNLHVLYIEVTKRGGFSKVVTLKKWREVSAIFGFSPTTTSASYALRKRYLKFLYPYENTYFLTPKSSTHSGHSSFQATGMIDTKFEYGYIVTMQLDTEILHGVLYHPQHSVIVSNNLDSTRRRRKRRNEGDPTRPKTNRSGYNFFFAEKHAELKSKYPLREREFTKMIGESWTNLCPEDKMVYQNQGLKDKERYQRELAEYKERAKEWKPKVTVD